MYQLYYLPNACSLATQVVMRELELPVEIIDITGVENFKKINPLGNVPYLVDGDLGYREGAAIFLKLLEENENTLLPKTGEARRSSIQNLMFANATVHPAYSKLFFIVNAIPEGKERDAALRAAATSVSALWMVVEEQLQKQAYLGGDSPSAADFLLAVYARWGTHLPVEIKIGKRASAMVTAVQARPSFVASLEAEEKFSAAA